MRIICPNCASHYEVDAGGIASEGQLVRCGQCREVWLVHTSETARSIALRAAPLRAERAQLTSREAQAAAAARRGRGHELEESTGPIDFQAARQRLRAADRAPAEQSGLRGKLGVVAVAALCVSAAALGVGYRASLAAHVPGAGNLLAGLGLGSNPYGLALRDVKSALVNEDGRTVLTLQGQIANLRGETTVVPALNMTVQGNGQTPLYRWTASAPMAKLGKGETVAFRSRLASPPLSGQSVQVSFAGDSIQRD